MVRGALAHDPQAECFCKEVLKDEMVPLFSNLLLWNRKTENDG